LIRTVADLADRGVGRRAVLLEGRASAAVRPFAGALLLHHGQHQFRPCWRSWSTTRTFGPFRPAPPRATFVSPRRRAIPAGALKDPLSAGLQDPFARVPCERVGLVRARRGEVRQMGVAGRGSMSMRVASRPDGRLPCRISTPIPRRQSSTAGRVDRWPPSAPQGCWTGGVGTAWGLPPPAPAPVGGWNGKRQPDRVERDGDEAPRAYRTVGAWQDGRWPSVGV